MDDYDSDVIILDSEEESENQDSLKDVFYSDSDEIDLNDDEIKPINLLPSSSRYIYFYCF